MNIGIIGFGHLGKALTKGLLYKNIVSSNELFVLAKSDKSIEIATKTYGANVCFDINDIIEKADILFWVLRGNVFEEISKDIHSDIMNKINVSFMAGIPISKIQEKIGDVYITRAMPNIAIDRANGIIGYTKTNHSYVDKIFNELGYAFEIEEKDIEKVTAFSSCGLGFAAYILNSFQEAGVNFGFSSEISEKIVARTYENAIAMSDYKATANAVATKGGATEQGIKYFEEENISSIISQAMNKAYEKMNQK